MRSVNPESPAEKQRRLASNQRFIEERSEKRARSRGGASQDVDIVNIFRDLGIDYLSMSWDQAIKLVPACCEGRTIEGFSPRAMKFLKANYDVEQVMGYKDNPLLHFTNGKESKMSIISDLVRRTDLPRKQIEATYDALLRQIHRDLKDNGRSQLPKLGIFRIVYRKASKGGTKPNPFKKGEMMKVKPRSASNKLKFRLSKDIRKFIEKEVPVKEK